MTQPNRTIYDEVMVPVYSPPSVVPVRGLGSRIWDQQGRDYIDFAAGTAVNALGHAAPELVAALTAQASRLWHVSNVMANEPAIQLAHQLIALTFAERVFFTNSGAEANEAAFKMVRRWGHVRFGPRKHTIVAFENGFHGRTLFTVSVGGQPRYREHFEPLPDGIRHVPFNNLPALESALDDSVCAVVMEPVQGEAGVLPATNAFAQGVRELCDRFAALLVYDEVQTGNGRTGSLYAYQQMGVIPDVLTTAKGLGGGFPIGAMLTTAEIAKMLPAGTHGTTFGGNPLACTVAAAVLEQVSSRALLANVKERGTQLQAGLSGLARQYGVFGEPRGMGLLLGVPLAEPWKGRAREAVDEILRDGLWLLVGGANVLRFAPPLNITAMDIDEGLIRLERTCIRLAELRLV